MSLTELDPFDLPEWLGEGDVVWGSSDGLRSGHRVTGELTGNGATALPCALLAVDDAFPAPVAPDDVRTRVHQAWRHGQVLLLDDGGTLTLALPGRRLDAELVMDAVGRLAKAVGASPDRWAVLLTIGTARR